jgi:adenylate cyclase
MIFADVRGSTGLAERASPADFSRLMNRFYKVATGVLLETEAVIDKFVGDEVVALYVPALAGAEHPSAAVRAGRELLRATGHGDPRGPWLPVGIGIHTGTAFVGAVGAEGVTDITALGDAVNTAARLASAAGPGEALVSEATSAAAGLGTGGLERRRLQLKGRSEPVGVRVLRVAPVGLDRGETPTR